MKPLRYLPILLQIAALTLSPASSPADPGNQYCITPPFITTGGKSNLLLMIDNSATMYDLAYQDSTGKYCSNAPTTACTADSQCAAAGEAFCLASFSTTTASTPAACTTDADCRPPNPGGVSGDTCYASGSRKNTCKAAAVTVTTMQPIGCSSDSKCTSSGGACPAGTTCTWSPNDTCNNRCGVTRQCYDTTYLPYSAAASYFGYFDPAATYSYDFAGGHFESGAAMPAICRYQSPSGTAQYLCVNTTGTGSTEKVVGNSTGFVASGNFLNWLTTSKLDIQKKILTGGKFDTAGNVLVGENRGCGGRKFIKSVPGVDLTFAIRGGTPGGIGSTQSQATEYGQTYIDISAGAYNAKSCLAAMNDWMSLYTNPVNLGTFQNDTRDCVGAGGIYDAVNMWNHIIHDCYFGVTNNAQGFTTNLNALEGYCSSAYATVAPSALTDPSSGIAVCSSALSYLDGDGNPRTGYLGACYDALTRSFRSPCDQIQMANFCTVNVNTNPVVDPSSTGFLGLGQGAPGFVLEQGLLNTRPVGSFPVRIALAAPPTGLIENYKDRISFGAMTFQNNGSGSECGATGQVRCVKACSQTATRLCYLDSDCPVTAGVQESCQALARTDGGKIIAYVGAGNCSAATSQPCDVDAECAALDPAGQYCVANPGNHETGLIRAIDDIQATSWTPFAEAFYNAIGYFGRWNDADYSASPPLSRSDSNFNALPLPNTAASYLASKNPSQSRCQKNNIMIITDGMSTADRHATSEAFAALYAPQIPYTTGGVAYNAGDSGYDAANVHGAASTCPPYEGSRSLAALAWIAKNRNIKTLSTTSPASTASPVQGSEYIDTYVVYSGPHTSAQPGLCDPYTLMYNTAQNGGTRLYSASSVQLLLSQLDTALLSVAAQVSSGTAASIISNNQGTGANILQAVFYPLKSFSNGTFAKWIGEVQNLWFYVDPLIDKSTIREDTDADLALNLLSDYVTRFTFDSTSGKSRVQLIRDTNGDGLGDENVGTPIDPEEVKSIWRAGKLLWSRDPALTPRTIYTPHLSGGTQVGSTGLMTFTYGNIGSSSFSDNSTALQPYLNFPDDNGAAVKLMKYVHGFDFPGDATMRSRTVTMGGVSGVWKLGDVISSTPRVQSGIPLGAYHLPGPAGYSDSSYLSYVNSNQYQSRGMVYVGANDGMLHAFRFGQVSVQVSGLRKAKLGGTGLGFEEWSFIPRSYLPYLNYLSDPSYGHLYAIDGRPVLVDASIGDTGSGACVRSGYWSCPKLTNQPVVTGANDLDPAKNTWRTVVIAGMGYGGASAKSAGDDQVATPAADPAEPTKGLGYSSYFALDVSDTGHPILLWEFNDPDLGYATSGAAIVRVGDSQKNGRWFAIFGSGPTGPIDTGTNQFLGRSNRTLKFFVVDLRSGTLVKTIDTGIANAFAGSMAGGAFDADRWNKGVTGNYQDDAVYVGYVKQGDDGSWNDGGVGRIMTRESLDPDDPVAPWTWSVVADGLGPVTTSVFRLQDKKNLNLWLFSGTGRYFYRDSANIDDYGTPRMLFGIKEPCYNTSSKRGNYLDGGCSAAIDPASLADQSTPASRLGAGAPGWKISLDESTTTSGAERVVTDTVALSNGTVFFTTFKPSLDRCVFGGDSFLWGVDYATGGQPAHNAVQGKAIVQLSTGTFETVDLPTAFKERQLRRTRPPMPGKASQEAPTFISNSRNRPVRKILQMQEH